MRLKAHAKINLRLKILGINEQNYHLLQMINVKIGLYDEVIIKKIKQSKIIIDMPGVVKEENIVYLVAERMFEKYQLPGGVCIKIKKKIPFGAGLGGGSTDAASIILAINQLYKLNLSKEDKQNIALEFGTDIVYCLENNPCLVERIGEKIIPFEKKIDKRALLINPNLVVSTKDIYNLYDNTNNYSKSHSLNELYQMSLENMLENDLEEVVFSQYPVIKNLKERIVKDTNLPVLMSGSGSTIFVLGDKKELKKWYRVYKKEYPQYQIYLTYIK